MHILNGRSTSLIGHTNTNRGVTPAFLRRCRVAGVHMLLLWGLDDFGLKQTDQEVTAPRQHDTIWSINMLAHLKLCLETDIDALVHQS